MHEILYYKYPHWRIVKRKSQDGMMTTSRIAYRLKVMRWMRGRSAAGCHKYRHLHHYMIGLSIESHEGGGVSQIERECVGEGRILMPSCICF